MNSFGETRRRRKSAFLRWMKFPQRIITWYFCMCWSDFHFWALRIICRINSCQRGILCSCFGNGGVIFAVCFCSLIVFLFFKYVLTLTAEVFFLWGQWFTQYANKISSTPCFSSGFGFSAVETALISWFTSETRLEHWYHDWFYVCET